jgi:tetraprenyl-beta-curcumene synthase
MRVWRARAQAASDAEIRADALNVFARKRTHLDGAALFWTLLDRRCERLLALLVSYEAAVDFLDYASERGAHAGERNGRQLHLALGDAVDPDARISAYYRYHPWNGDGGYLRALVTGCRLRLTALPSYPRVRALAAREAARAPAALAANHAPDPRRRDRALETWAAREFPCDHQLSWFELAAAVSGALANHLLLALAADRRASAARIQSTYAAYLPWVALSTAMLDSYADRAEDEASGDHSYVTHYPDHASMQRRLEEIVATTMDAVLALPRGRRHAVIVSSMIAMYLTKDSMRAADARAGAAALAAAGGPLPRLMMPVLRAWRILTHHRAA